MERLLSPDPRTLVDPEGQGKMRIHLRGGRVSSELLPHKARREGARVGFKDMTGRIDGGTSSVPQACESQTLCEYLLNASVAVEVWSQAGLGRRIPEVRSRKFSTGPPSFVSNTCIELLRHPPPRFASLFYQRSNIHIPTPLCPSCPWTSPKLCYEPGLLALDAGP
jgi:hypothetical protein